MTEDTTYIAIYLWSLVVLVGWLVLHSYVSRRQELLSFRNFFLAGLALFQLHGVARALWYGDYGGFIIYDPHRAAVEFAWLITAFLSVFLISYRGGWLVRKLARRIPSVQLSARPETLLAIAAIMTVFALPMRLVGVPGLGFLSKHMGTGLTAVAAGIVAWVFVTTRPKPAMMAVGGGLIGANALISVWRTYGRRALVGVLAALIWTAYYGRWRHYPTAKLVPRLVVLGLGLLLTVAFYTTIRREFMVHPDPFSLLGQGSASAGLSELSSGQRVGAASLWVIENFPERFESRPLMSLRYIFMLPIPRSLWFDKPEPLSAMVVTLARIPKRSADSTIPPGVIGYAAAEGGFFAVIVYGLFFGLLMRLGDEYVRTREPSAFVIAPTAAALGQVVGIPRGDLAIFTGTMVFTTILMSLLMVALAKVVGRRSLWAREAFVKRPVPDFAGRRRIG